MTDKRVEMVNLLISRTSDGVLKWEYPNESTVRTPFGSSFLVVTKQPAEYGEFDYFVTIYNSDGKIVERFSDVDLYNITEESWYVQLHGLFESAKRSALGTDKVIDDILNALKR